MPHDGGIVKSTESLRMKMVEEQEGKSPKRLIDLDDPEVQKGLRRAKRIADRWFGWLPQSRERK